MNPKLSWRAVEELIEAAYLEGYDAAVEVVTGYDPDEMAKRDGLECWRDSKAEAKLREWRREAIIERDREEAKEETA